MAFGTKGWRRIVVANRSFYWRAAYDLHDANLFQVRPETEPHRHLRVTNCPCGKRPYYFFRGATPHPVRLGIESALRAGWCTERPKLLQVVFGDPQRCADIAPAWLTSTVVALATGIGRDRAFDRLPILADALQDAGCDNDELLHHCRQPDGHVWSCCVVDMVLGKS